MNEKDILEIINNITSSGRDIKARKLSVSGTDIYILFIMHITDRDSISKNIIKPILCYKGEDPLNADRIADSIIYSDDIFMDNKKEDILNSVLDGNTVILVAGDDNFLKVNTLKVEKRGVESPELETALRAPRDAFTENLDTNLSLIRYRIKDPSLCIKYFSIGTRTKTDIALIYLKDVANPEYVNKLKKRLSDIQVDGVLESGLVQKLITGDPALFPEMGTLERSDSACSHILDGRVCIVVNGSNLGLVAPMTFMEFLDSGDDHYNNSYFSIFVKFLRVLALAITLTLSSFYVAVVAYHPEVLPSQYILALASSRIAVPVNAFLEAMLMEIVGELLREGSVRLPKQIGPAISIVGTIVIGQAAVAAGLVSPLMVIIVALSSMTSFAVPDFTLMNAIRLLKFMLLIFTGVFGLFGFMMGINIIAVRIASTTSFGVPYTAPAAPFNLRDVMKFFFSNAMFEKERASYLKTKDKKRK
ncbi:spore germination protein [Lutispora saccharofermentans]|uniref:Spore germination protein n=1 Tax=Lutispora saccharofermentans TaxID=3024236 RepID=A0ABT1NKJ3_9FIRM|nr:spore germination protein [Lutispora saccharofermentans]MCQ1531779.1 spore germination protein [Lutispora saccharofermentans]